MIKTKKMTCRNKYNESYKFDEPQTNLYIVLTRNCNAKCRFCEYNKGESKISIDKFEETFSKIYSMVKISTVHFTGGEPTLEIDKLEEICNIVKACDDLISTSVNTNGVRLDELQDIKNLDNVALSRHAIIDKENQEVFGTDTVATLKDIANFRNKRKIHLSCNLIQGYIDSVPKIIDYLEMAASVDINDTGVVSLMGINDFCNKHFVDFSKLGIEKYEQLKKVRCFENIDDDTEELCCKCENYLYQASNMKIVSMYHRYAIKNNSIADYLVYDNDILRQGFNGEIVSI